MIKRTLIVLVTMIFALLICGCFEEEKVITADMRGGKINEKPINSELTTPTKKDKTTSQETNGRESTPIAKVKTNSTIEQQLSSMTLEEKIGQMIMIGIYDTDLNDDISFLLNEFHFGGVIFYDRNLESVAQAKKFANNIETIANQKVPLFFALDEEGGTVARGEHLFKVAPSQEEIGFSGDVSEATRWAEHNANILRSIGVNLNFAPVADVGSRDTRSFGDDAQTVAEFVEASAQGYEAENFLYTLKHFPGIGKSKIDPHQEVSSVEVDRDTLDTEDLPPFERIISGHDNSRFMIMVGHLRYDALDPVNSASLSPVVMTKLLRNELGFTGVVITDDLDMGAIVNNVDVATLGVRMIQAGGDIALIRHNYESQQTVYNSILNAVKRGEISEARIDESVRRILKMKAHLH